MLETRRLEVAPLLTHRFPFERAAEAYTALLEDRAALGIMLSYDASGGGAVAAAPASILLAPRPATRPSDAPRVAVIGAGNYARRFLLPPLRDSGARLVTLAAQGSALAAWAARRMGFEELSSDAAAAIASPATDTVVIATRHDSHAAYVCAALAAGKHVFVEKPLALTEAELGTVELAYAAAAARGAPPLLMVGFNRRYAPHTLALRDQLGADHGAALLPLHCQRGCRSCRPLDSGPSGRRRPPYW